MPQQDNQAGRTGNIHAITQTTYLIVDPSTWEERFMAEESGDISSMTVIGIGIVICVMIVGAWYLFLK